MARRGGRGRFTKGSEKAKRAGRKGGKARPSLRRRSGRR